jgi:ectoine hydroxylase-related dioxygenase (phytanoyl-CoA dioxygenase family)
VGDTPWHGGSGIIKWPLTHIKVSIYLDTLTKGNGCLHVIPGSHRNFLRQIDKRWAEAPDYMEVLRNRNYSPDFRPYGVAPSEVPSVNLECQTGDVQVFTEDLIHASFGGPPGRYQLTLNFLANPRTDDQIYFLKQRYSRGQELRPAHSYVHSDRPRIRRMVSRLVELGFETSNV